MKNRIVGIALLFLLLTAGTSFVWAAESERDDVQGGKKEISIIFSHDMHSHMDAEKIVKNGVAEMRGGFAKLQTLAEKIRKEYPNSFMLDGGDFAMGTPYQTIYSTQASELRMMGALQYDATTFGNHEFDYRAGGLANMLQAAVKSGERLPLILSANIDWERSLADEDKKAAASQLKSACDAYDVKPYSLIEKGGIRIAVFGLLGKEADEFAPESGLYFKEPVETAKTIVNEIKQGEKADAIVCLSHSGTNENPDKSEDEILAREVPDIDVIISGHSHTELAEPIVVGDTILASCGSYTYNLGHLVLEKGSDGTAHLKNYELLPLDGRVREDQSIVTRLAGFEKLVDQEYFSQFGFHMNDVLTKTDQAFTDIEQFAMDQGEDTLGNLIADSYLYAVSQAEGVQARPVDVAVVPAGVVRASFGEGPITAADAFNVLSLGYGKDKITGYPLVSAYLTGKELKAAAEVDVSVSNIMQVARLYMSGLAYNYNPNRLFLNRATDVRRDLGNGTYKELENDELYRVVADLYSCQMLGSVKEKSFGLLSIEPKDEEGQPIKNFEDHIIYHGDHELKAWYALASYLKSFDDGTVPDRYHKLQGRKVEMNSLSPVELLKQPGKVLFMAAGALLLLTAVIVIVVRLLLRRKRRHAIGSAGE